VVCAAVIMLTPGLATVVDERDRDRVREPAGMQED